MQRSVAQCAVMKEKLQQWSIDTSMRHDQRHELPSPPGWSNERYTNNDDVSTSEDRQHTNLVDKRAWDMALAPIKQLPMNAFIMYMAGNTISIFPIMMVGMMFFRPFQAFMGMRGIMKALEGSQQYVLQTLAYAVGNLMALALAVYKCNSMGLLPTHASDWLSFAESPIRAEYVGGGQFF